MPTIQTIGSVAARSYGFGEFVTTGYNLTKSLRFRSSASAYLNRTFGSSGNRNKWTWSGWRKRGQLGVGLSLFASYPNGTSYAFIQFTSGDNLRFAQTTTGGNLITSQVFRDPSSWYHLVVAYDDTQATASNRVKIYVNGVQVTSFGTSTYPDQNFGGYINGGFAHYVSETGDGTGFYDGYAAEDQFIDGQQLTPSSFGSFNSVTGVWQPAKYTGTYGTNGFYLPFTNTTSTTTLGYDSSGNGNNWTVNNISLTAGSTYDSMTDVPTLTSATVANYCVLNPLDKNANLLISNANLTYAFSGIAAGFIRGTIGITSGKWYFEITPSNIGNGNCEYGVVNSLESVNNYIGADANGWGFAPQPSGSSYKYNNGTATAYGTANGTGVYAIAVDADAGKIWFSDNTGAWIASGNPSTGSNASFTGLTGTLFPAIGHYSGTSQNTAADANFGQQPFTYTPPSGYVALNAYNLPTPTIAAGNKYMDATLWTGNNASPRSITNAAGFQPDLVWVKMRSSGYQHAITDSVRGGNQVLHSNSTSAEDTNWQYGYLQSFNSNGFTMQAGSTSIENYNLNNETFVGWQWQAGKGTTSSNTNGSITSTVSVNASAGFSIVTYTGTGSAATVGHGLGVAPSFIVFKSRNNGSGDSGIWPVYHSSLGATNVIILNLTNAVVSASNFNNTTPTSSVFSIGSGTSGTNAGTGATYVAYCWAAIPGFSAFGSYTGNGSNDGPFVYIGFRPKYVLIRRYQSSGYWLIYDSSRDTYNVVGNNLYANTADAEGSYPSLDFLSNGFKIRTNDPNRNVSGEGILYAAFAENPFKYALAR